MLLARLANLSILAALFASGTFDARAGCAIDDTAFSMGNGGCEDAQTGLIWSSDVLEIIERTALWFDDANEACSQFANGRDTDGNGVPDIVYPEAGGFTDWRAPTVREVFTALENGLGSHLDYGYEAGVQPPTALKRWTQCEASLEFVLGRKYKQYFGGFAVNHSDGSFTLQQSISGPEGLLCVRGVPANSDADCPNSKGELPSDDGGSGGGKGNGKGKNAMLLPRSAMGSLLLLPAMVIGSVGLVRRRG